MVSSSSGFMFKCFFFKFCFFELRSWFYLFCVCVCVCLMDFNGSSNVCCFPDFIRIRMTYLICLLGVFKLIV